MKYPVKFDLELKKNPYKGLYIALEGIDGSGKTTQAEHIADYLKKGGQEVVVTHEPQRRGIIGKIIHKVLQEEAAISAISLQYLFSADRAIHQEKLVIPALKEGKIVISDRTFWSGIPYGIIDRGGEIAEIDSLVAALSILSMYNQFIAPDLTFYLDIDVAVASERLTKMKRKAEIYEKTELLGKVKKVYELLIHEFKDDFYVIDGKKAVSEITNEMVSAIEKKR